MTEQNRNRVPVGQGADDGGLGKGGDIAESGAARLEGLRDHADEHEQCDQPGGGRFRSR